MNFLDYVKKLIPVFEKNDILENTKVLRTTIIEHSINAYSSASDLWQGQKFKSPEMKDYIAYYIKNNNVSRNENIIDSILSAFKNSLLILNALDEKGKNIFSEKEASVSITYTKATILRLLDAIEFAGDYSLRFLNYIYILETNFIVEEPVADDILQGVGTLPPAEIKWLKDNYTDFCLCIKIMSLPFKSIIDHLEKLPDASITELTEKTFVSTVGQGKMDPLNLQHFSAKINPFYFYGIHKAEYQAKKYKSTKEELELVQLRKLQLERTLAKNYDAKLEKEIAYMQNRVTGLIYNISKMEEDYGQ